MISSPKPRTTPIEIARMVFPDPRATDDQLEYLIWNETGYPSFWMTNNPPSDMLRQLQAYKDEWEQSLSTEEYGS